MQDEVDVLAPIAAKDFWVSYALNRLRFELTYHPTIVFTAEQFVEMFLYPKPADKRWVGAVFQRAKREGLIKQLTSTFENWVTGIVTDVPATALTRAGHRTPVWCKA